MASNDIIDEQYQQDNNDDDNRDSVAVVTKQQHQQRQERTTSSSSPAFPAHMQNPQIAKWIQYGIPLYFCMTTALLLASDIGSGVTAIRIVVPSSDILPKRQDTLLEASIFSAVRELWNADSYALTMLIVVTSVTWPYVNILLSLYAWFMPLKQGHAAKRRERMLEIMDAAGKWALVDVVVFVVIVAAFRSSVPVGGGVTVEVYIIPEWGLFGFMIATMMSHAGTQAILYQHRKVIYEALPQDDQVENEEPSSSEPHKGLHQVGAVSRPAVVGMSLWLLSGFATYLAGCMVYVFAVINQREGLELDPIDYSIVSVAQRLPDANLPDEQGKARILQIIWYFLGVAMPLVCYMLLAALLWAPLSKKQLESLFFWAQVSFDWSAAEVILISTIVAISEIPNFGDGLIESGCEECYVIDSELYPHYSILAIGVVMNIVASFWIFRWTHAAVYEGRLRTTEQLE